MVNYFLDILHQFIITNNYLHFSSYFRQSKILSDINGRRTLRGPTYEHSCKILYVNNETDIGFSNTVVANVYEKNVYERENDKNRG